MENKITEKELEKIKDQQNRIGKILNDIGYLESNKHALLHELAEVNQSVEEFKEELEKKYGQVNISLEDGSYTDLEKEEPSLAPV